MQFMLVIYADGSKYPAPESAENATLHRGWMEYTQAMNEAGVVVAGAALQPPTTATTIRGTELLLTDGPFSETKEQLAGFYVVDVADRAAAQDWAGRAPHLGFGSVEVRPVMVIGGE